MQVDVYLLTAMGPMNDPSNYRLMGPRVLSSSQEIDLVYVGGGEEYRKE